MYRLKTAITARVSRFIIAGSLVLSALIVPAVAQAANTCTWTGSGADANWSTVGNWSGCGGVAPANGDSVVFPNAASRKTNVNDISSRSLANLTIGGGYTITGSALTVTDLMTVDTTTATTSFSPNIVFGPHSGGAGNTVLTATSSSNTFNFNGTVTLATVSGADMVMNVGSYLSFNAAIGGATHALTMNNSNQYATFAVNNTFTASAGVTVNGPFIWCGANTCFGASSNVVTITGGTRVIATNDLTLPNDLICNTSDMCFYTNIGGVDYTLTGHITLQQATNFSTQGSAGMTGTLTGLISGTAALSVGPGTMSIGGNSTFTGAVTVNGSVTATSATAFGIAANTVDVQSGKSLTLAGDFDLANPISGAGTVIISSGTHNLTGTFTSAGPTTLSAGTLSVNTDASSSAFNISGGILKGTGTLGTTTFTGGTLAPGNSPGIIHITGNLTLPASPGSLQEQINGATAGTGYDQTLVTGTANLNGAVLDASLGYTPAASSTFTILTASSVTGTFAGLADGATFTVGSTTFTIHYTSTAVTLTTPAAPVATLASTGQNTAPITLSALALVGFGIYLARPRRFRNR